MDKFKESLITNAGRKMLLGLGAGSSQLTYTKAVLYDQDLSSMEDDQIRALTALSGEKLSTEIKQVKVKDNTVIAYAVFQNADLVDDVIFRAVGWYAKSSVDNVEHLLAISPSIGTQTLASGSPDHRSTAEIDINLAMAISDSVNVTVQIDPTGMVNNRDLDNAINTVKIELEDKISKAGQVKSVTMNSAKHTPDTSGDVNLGDTLLPGLTSVTVGSDDVDIVYKSGKNRYTADITNALNNVINSAINNGHLTEEQKKEALESATIEFIDAEQNQTHSDPTYYSASHQQATYDAGSNKFTFNNSGTMWALNNMHQEMTQKISGISEMLGTLDSRFGKTIQALDTSAVKSVNSITPVSGNVTLDTVDTVSVVNDSNVAFADFIPIGGDTSAPDMKLTQTSSKTNATTLVSKTAFEKVTQQLGQALKLFNSMTSTNYSVLSNDVANIKANYATKQWVTDNFMPKPYITNNSSTADTYSKAHPDQLVILTK